MKKTLVLSLIFTGFLVFGFLVYEATKRYGFFAPSSPNYYKANPQKSDNYYKAQYYKTVPKYYKANPKNADNYINANENPPKNYYKAPTKTKPQSREGKTMEAVKSGFK